MEARKKREIISRAGRTVRAIVKYEGGCERLPAAYDGPAAIGEVYGETYIVTETNSLTHYHSLAVIRGRRKAPDEFCEANLFIGLKALVSIDGTKRLAGTADYPEQPYGQRRPALVALIRLNPAAAGLDSGAPPAVIKAPV